MKEYEGGSSSLNLSLPYKGVILYKYMITHPFSVESLVHLMQMMPICIQVACYASVTTLCESSPPGCAPFHKNLSDKYTIWKVKGRIYEQVSQ